MIEVSCAIITDCEHRILVTQRGPTMSLPNKWEFPGGKVEPNETPEDSLIREIKEELDIHIKVIARLNSSTHSYGSQTICLIPFTCKILNGTISLYEHQEYRWLKSNELLDLDWAEADLPILKELLNYYL